MAEAKRIEKNDGNTKLHRLLKHKEFERAERRIGKDKPFKLSSRSQEEEDNDNEEREEEKEEHWKPEVEVEDGDGNLPLHIALNATSRAPYEIVEKLVKKYKEGVQKPSIAGDLPLHLACSPTFVHKEGCKPMAILPGSDLEKTVELLMRTYPQAISKKSGEGATAIHAMLEHRPPLNLVLEMIRLADGLTINTRSKHLVDIEDCQGQLPLHVAIQYHAPTDVIIHLLTVKNETVRAKMDHGYLPLHFATMWGCTSEVLNQLLGSYRSAIKAKTKNEYGGDTPLHLVFHETTVDKWCKQDKSQEDPENKVILGFPGDILSPENIVRRIILFYYDGLRTRPCTNRKKKRCGVLTEPQALSKVKALLEVKNNAGMTVIQQAQYVKNFFNVPDDLMIYLKQLSKCEVDLENERFRLLEDADSSNSDSSSNEEDSEAGRERKRQRIDHMVSELMS